MLKPFGIIDMSFLMPSSVTWSFVRFIQVVTLQRFMEAADSTEICLSMKSLSLLICWTFASMARNNSVYFEGKVTLRINCIRSAMRPMPLSDRGPSRLGRTSLESGTLKILGILGMSFLMALVVI